MPAPLRLSGSSASSVAPPVVFSALVTLAGVSLGLPGHFESRGLAFALVLSLAGLFVPSTSLAPKLRAVAFLFAPALAFPGVVSALLSLVAFFLWWLASSSGVPRSTRAALLHDLGFLATPSAPSKGLRAKEPRFILKSARKNSIQDTVGLLALALAMLCVPLLLSFQGASKPASWLVFFLVSVASWEHVFRALRRDAAPLSLPHV